MLKKAYLKAGGKCRVTFKLPGEVQAQGVFLCGDFNNWERASHPMNQLKDGSFSLTVTLETGRQYRFRYLLDGEKWENDWEADGYVPNEFGTEDSIVEV